jgi:hypothetical protein
MRMPLSILGLASLAFSALARPNRLLAQTPSQTIVEPAPAPTLPEAPSASSQSPGKSPADPTAPAPVTVDSHFPFINLPLVPISDKCIEPGQPAPRLTAGGKIKVASEYAFSPFDAAGWFLSAGYSQIRNNPPNYGTDRGAFGQRLGAEALDDVSESFLGDALMSNLLHEDPRYYVLGQKRRFFERLFYASTRPLITKKDDGASTPNFALLSGNLATAGLTNLYYPPINRGPIPTMKTFGTSVGGAALGDIGAEFYGDIVQLLHLHHR